MDDQINKGGRKIQEGHKAWAWMGGTEESEVEFKNGRWEPTGETRQIRFVKNEEADDLLEEGIDTFGEAVPNDLFLDEDPDFIVKAEIKKEDNV